MSKKSHNADEMHYLSGLKYIGLYLDPRPLAIVYFHEIRE